MRRLLLALTPLLLPAATRADLDPGVNQPYHLKVVLQVGAHRLLTPAFRGQLRRDLDESLKAAFGPLARVEVTNPAATSADVWPQLWKDVRTHGLAALDGHSETGLAKTHFIQVEYADGEYALSARQHDGPTGLSSPLVRQARTADRAFVARLALLLIDQDFGPVGTLTKVEGDRAQVRFQGGAILGVDLGRWVKSGDVFALARVGEGPGARGERVEFALLRARSAPRNGECECELFHRFQNPTDGWPTTGYRAIKLGTSRAPVRLRLVDDNRLPLSDVSVFVSPSGFGPNDVRDSGTARDGLFETTRSYERIAFVRVASGETNLAQVPLAILDDRVVTCRVPAAAGGVALVQFEIDAQNCRGRFKDMLSRLDEQDKQTGQLIAERKNTDALERVRSSLERLGPELGRIGEELAKLKTASRDLPSDAGQGLQACAVYDREIHRRAKGLTKLKDDLERAVAKADSPEAQDEKEKYSALVQRAAQEEERAEYEKAIATYEEILTEAGEWKEIHDRLDKLKKEWEPRNEKHREARDFIFKKFDAVASIDELEAQLPKARAAFQTCKAVGDKLGPRRLLLKLLGLSDLVAKEAAQLNQSTNEEDKPRLEQVKKLGESLKSLLQEVADYFEAKKP